MTRASSRKTSLVPSRCTSPHSRKRNSLDWLASGKLADLVKENRSALGGMNLPQARLHGAGEGAAGMAKELGFYQRFRNRRAVDGDEWLVGTRAELMHGLGDQFLSGAGFPGDEHGSGVPGDCTDQRGELPHGLAGADHSGQRHECAGQSGQRGRSPVRWRSERAVREVELLETAVGGIVAQLLRHIDGAVPAVQQNDIGAWELAFHDADQFLAIQVRKLAVQHTMRAPRRSSMLSASAPELASSTDRSCAGCRRGACVESGVGVAISIDAALRRRE